MPVTEMDSLWSKVKQLNCSSTSHASVVDGISGLLNIASLFASNLCSLLILHSLEHHFTPSLMMLFISISISTINIISCLWHLA